MNITNFKNGKYFLGKYNRLDEHRGWFVGAFFGAGHPCKTEKVEVLYKEPKKGEICKAHYHQ